MTKRLKRTGIILLALMMLALTGCGNTAEGMNDAEQKSQSTENGKDKKNLLSPGEFGSTDKKNELTEGSMENSSEADGEGQDGMAGQNADEDASPGTGSPSSDLDNMAEDVGDAVDDVADGVGDAIDNLGGGSFESYEDAKKYLLDKLQKDNASAAYEVREETEDLTAYNGNDSGAEGYKFSVYETDGNEKIGIYYVDKDTGKIYRYMGKNAIESY